MAFAAPPDYWARASARPFLARNYRAGVAFECAATIRSSAAESLPFAEAKADPFYPLEAPAGAGMSAFWTLEQGVQPAWSERRVVQFLDQANAPL